MGMIFRLCKLLFCLGLLALSVSCGGVAPSIIEVSWRLNIQFTPRASDVLRDENTLGREALSVFVRPADEDGLEDLDSMYLINRDEDLFWALDSTQWQSITSSRVFWIGSNQFSCGYLENLPRGHYIVEIYDKAGEMSARSFEMQAPSTRDLGSVVAVPPQGDELLFLLPEDVSMYSIVGYKVNNEVLFTDANYQSIISLKELKIRNDELEKVMLAFEFPNNYVVARLGPYMVPRVSSGREEIVIEDAAQDLRQDSPDAAPDAVPEVTLPEVPIDTYIPTPEEVKELEQNAGTMPPGALESKTP